jgi:hypothetical protein
LSEPVVCPVCRQRNEQPPLCRRCKADLGLLFALETQRARTLAIGLRALSEGDADTALTQADCAEEMRNGSDARRLRALAHLLRHEFDAAFAVGVVVTR